MKRMNLSNQFFIHFLSIGVDEKLDYLNQMKVKGLILGPIHTVQADQSNTLELTSINPEFGTESDLQTLLDRAHRKGEPWLYILYSAVFSHKYEMPSCLF